VISKKVPFQPTLVTNTHKILGITFHDSLTWKAQITEAKAKAAKKMNVLRSLAGTIWGADQGMLLRIDEMFILSALEYGSIAYGSSTDGQLKRLEPIHNCPQFIGTPNQPIRKKTSQKKSMFTLKV
jgi:hypothetical protein